jgi:sugar lactone lactonase YvrE
VTTMWRTIATLIAIAALAAGGTAAFADDGGGRGGHDGKTRTQDNHGSSKGDDDAKGEDRAKGDDHAKGDDNAAKPDDDADVRAAAVVYTLSGSHGNPEGIAFDKHSGSFFVSATGDGSIWRGKLGDTATPVPTFIPGAAGNSATGMKVFKGKLYVSGASTGTIKVYDVDSGALLAVFNTEGANPGPTFINDLVVTRHGDVFATDSFRPAIYHLTADEIAGGTPAPKAINPADVIDTSPEIPFAGGGAFNLNGIVESKGGRHRDTSVTVVDTNTGQFFRVDVGATNADRDIAEIPVEGGPIHGDGLLVDRGRLLAVEGSVPPSVAPGFQNGAVAFVKLRHGGREGELEERRGDASLAGPSTIARARDEYLVVNANFAGGSAGPFTVTGLPRDDG